MAKGTVKLWRAEKGFGFVRLEGDDHDTFLHVSGILDPRDADAMDKGVQIECSMGERQGRPIAKDIRILED